MFEFLLITFLGLAVYGLVIFIQQTIDEHKKTKNMTNDERHAYFKAERERAEKSKYNNFMYTCPMCGDKKIRRIDAADRLVSVSLLGLGSGKIGKQYECDNCKYRW